MTEYVLREQRNKILILTLNRPEKGNSIIPDLARQMDKYLNEAEADDSVAAVIITGAGPKIFCGGMDLKFLAEFRIRRTACLSPDPALQASLSAISPSP